MTLMFDLGMLLLGEIRYVFVNINDSSPTASLGMLKWAKNEENLALQDVFSKVFEVSTMWTTVMKDFTEEVFIIFVLLNLYYFLNKNIISNYCVAFIGKVIVNPLSPMSNQDKISPYNINAKSSRKVMRIKKNIN